MLAENEVLVRYTVVDPLLRALGWELDNPEQVMTEYKTEKGRVDYALFIEGLSRGKPVAFIEVKALGKLTEESLDQIAKYALYEGVSYVVVTDGDQWALYDMSRQVPLKEREVLRWSLLKDDPAEVAFKALSIANTKGFGKKPSEPLLAKAPRPEAEEAKPEKRGAREPLTEKNARKLVLKVLAESTRPLARKEIVKKVGELVELTEKDLEPVKSGLPRWEAKVRWEITRLAREGLVESKGKNQWVITEKGRAYLEGG